MKHGRLSQYCQLWFKVMSTETFYINTESERQACMRAIDNPGHYEVTIKPITPEKYRSGQQNKAIHQGARQIADRCKLAGITKADLYSKVAKHEDFNCVDEHAAKEVLQVICLHLTGEPHTSSLKPNQVSEMWELASLAFSQRLSLDIGDFPSMEAQRIESMINSGQV